MTRTLRQLLVGVMMTVQVGVGRPVVAAEVDAPPFVRVRSTNASIIALIQLASEQSHTFRGLVTTVNASDGIVYVEDGTCAHGVRACFVSVTAAGRNRLLRVIVDTRKADWDVMGSIGHELRHTIEVLSDRTVTSSSSMYLFYSRVGTLAAPGVLETSAAVEAGNTVQSEVLRYRARAKAK